MTCGKNEPPYCGDVATAAADALVAMQRYGEALRAGILDGSLSGEERAARRVRLRELALDAQAKENAMDECLKAHKHSKGKKWSHSSAVDKAAK